MLKNQGKKVFLVATDDEQKKTAIENLIKSQFSDSIVFTASDHNECQQKLQNAPPHLLITDYKLPKGNSGQLIDSLLKEEESKHIGIMVIGPIPENENYMDHLVTGRIRFLESITDEEEFVQGLKRTYGWSAKSEDTGFTLRFLNPGDVLMRKGDSAKHVYIVKKGTLKAVQKNSSPDEVVLGEIGVGEFVGEMAYFSGEPRIADVVAVTSCELIEVPVNTFERILYARPGWTKALLESLTKRLRRTMAES